VASIDDDPDGPCLTVLPPTRVIGLSVRIFPHTLSSVQFWATLFHVIFATRVTAKLTTALVYSVHRHLVDDYGADTSRVGDAKLYSEREGSTSRRMEPHTDACRCVCAFATWFRNLAGARCHHEREMDP